MSTLDPKNPEHLQVMEDVGRALHTTIHSVLDMSGLQEFDQVFIVAACSATGAVMAGGCMPLENLRAILDEGASGKAHAEGAIRKMMEKGV